VTFELLILVAGAVLVLDTSTSRVVVAYVVVVAIVGHFAAASTLHAPLALAFFSISFFLKAIVAPIGIWTFARRNAAARNLRPAVDLPIRLVVVLALAFGSQYVPHMPGLAPIPMVGTIAYIMLCSFAVLVIHRNLLAQVIGLLVLSAGVTLAAVMSAPQLPEAVELGATFDALVVTFIGLTLVRAFLTHHPLLDIESLRSLRG
jgi:hydrogenase-4 membrane subunit HyfE